MPVPLDAKPGLVVRCNSLLSRDLAALANKHGLMGCVLVTFNTRRVGTASWARTDAFRTVMEDLADKVLVRIDDGKLDPAAPDDDPPPRAA